MQIYTVIKYLKNVPFALSMNKVFGNKYIVCNISFMICPKGYRKNANNTST